MTAVIQKVGIIGAGQMGSGIAQVAAQAGFDVVLNDISRERIEAALATINGNLQRRVARGEMTEEARQTGLARLESADNYDALGACDETGPPAACISAIM